MRNRPSKDIRRLFTGRKLLNILLWGLIALLAILIGVWTLWAGHQPDVPSIWAPD